MKIISEDDLDAGKIAAKFLSEGKIVAFATDTVYGLAVDATNSEAVSQLFKIKNRNQNKPFAIFVKDLEIAKKIFVFNDLANKIANKFLPGRLTLILEKNPESPINIASNINNNDNFLGFRVIKTNFLDDLFKNFSNIIALTSANISQKKAAISADEIKNNEFLQNIDLLVDGGICKDGEPSTIVKVVDDKIEILRTGKIKICENDI